MFAVTLQFEVALLSNQTTYTELRSTLIQQRLTLLAWCSYLFLVQCDQFNL